MSRAAFAAAIAANAFRRLLGRRLRLSFAFAGIFLLSCHLSAADERKLQPLGPPLKAAGSFNASPSTRLSVSGIACDRGAQQSGRKCVVALDEGAQARFAELGTGFYRADGAPVVLDQNEKNEVDAEGAATDGTYFYVTGSHSVKREDCTENPASRVVIRFPVRQNAGTASSDHAQPADLDSTDKLWMRLSEIPELGANKCLKHAKGLNIEGLAVKGDRLYFGLRGPAADGVAFIVSVDKNALFAKSTTDLQLQIKRLDVAPGHGVRDMAAVNDGFLLIIGPDDRKDDKPLPSMLALWDGQSTKPDILGAFALDDVRLRTDVDGCVDKELKPEAVLVREDASDHYAITILFDGMCDGGPLEFLVTR